VTDRIRLSRRAALIGGAAIAASTAGCGAHATAPPPPPHSDPPPPPTTSRPPTPPALPAEVVHGPRDRPAVALTFHGQGDEATVVRLLDVLKAGGARATVLAVGVWLQQLPAMATRILDGGHELGNHTQNHRDIKAMTDAQAFAEINGCAEELRKLTGSIGRWFRPSQTQYSTAMIRAQSARAGYPTCLSYDLDTLDYTDPGATAVTHNTLQTVQNGSIISLHFGHPGTVTAMPGILDGLRTRGLHAVTMTELMS
jgi:peptidoglycan/xylan/chitin deacetylase (PgdA/CDA1 family)